jgi:multidrug efflux pump subunit AcrB
MAAWFQARGVTWIIARYQRTLGWALTHRKSTVGLAAASFVVTFAAFSFFNAGVEYFPESIPPATVYARIDVPSGTSPEFTNELADRIQAGIGELAGAADFESVVATVAGSSAGGGLFSSSAEGSVAVNFIDFEDRSTDVFETMRRMQETVGAGLAGADIKVEKQNMGPPSGPAVNIEIVGPEVEVLKTLSDQAIEVLESAPVARRLEGLKSDMTRGRPELVVEVDRERAALYDLSTSDVGFTVRTAIQGTEAAKFRYGKDEYDIVVRLEESDREDLDALRDLTVMSEGRQIPLNSVAKWRVDEGLGTVRRKDLDRVATLQSDVRTGENSNSVLAEVRTTLADFERELPAGYTMRYTGQQEDQQEAMEFLSRAFLVALFLIAFILMSEFNSVITPLIIMTSVIMSTVGVLLGLMVFRMPFGIIMTGLGGISLAGVVVNNAIVLIDYVQLLRSRDGLSRTDALMRAGSTRFRPVILTAATTVLGLVPLAVGFNFDFFGFFRALRPNIFWGGEQAAWWAPMAIAVIVGLSLATVLTLVLVPVLYSMVDDVGLWFQRTFAPAGAEEAESGRLAGEEAGRGARPRRRRLAGALARFQRADSLRAAPDGS